MIDQGLYTDPEERLEAWAGQSLRAARVMIDVGLHTKGMTLDQAAVVLYEKGLAAATLEDAARDVRGRYALMPTQAMTYMVGRRQIEQLRDAWIGKNASRPLSEFHRAFLSYGPLPPKSIRRLMKL
jgi:uncharacterized protein (DUF885 family)